MRMLGADIRTYPRFAYYVRHNLPDIMTVPAVVTAMQRIGQIDLARLRLAAQWGHGPMISIVLLVGAYGEFTPGVGSQEIRIQRRVVEDFEAGRGVRLARAGRVYLVGVTLLHELVHWGDDQDGIDRAGEEGEEFERLTYGVVIH